MARVAEGAAEKGGGEAESGTLGPMRSLSYLVLRTSAIF